jgi:molybdate transport system permease protein
VAVRRAGTLPLLVALATIGIAFVTLPLVALLVRAPWSRITDTLSSAGAWTALRLSVEISLISAALCVLLGVPIAYALSRSTWPGRTAVRALVLLPLVLPPVVGGVALLAALGRSGIVGRFLFDAGIQLTFTTAGAVVATTFVSLPLVVLAVEAGLRSMDTRLEDAAATLGASRSFAFLGVILPLLRSQIVAGGVLAWARALGEFGATITFAGNLAGRTQTLPLAVFEARQVDPEGAVMVSLLMIALSLGVLIAMRRQLFPR